MAGLVTLGVGIAMIFRAPFYQESSGFGVIIQILLDSTLYILNIYSILTSHGKNYVWCKLLKNLKTVDDNYSIREHSNYWRFIGVNVLFWGGQTYMSYWGYSAIGFDFFRQFAIEYLQMYDELVINFLFYAVLTMLLTRYHALTKQQQYHLFLLTKYGNTTQFTKACSKIKLDFCRLKVCADIANDIFGWPLLFTIVYACLQTLLYLEIIVVTPISLNSILYVLIIIFLHYVSNSNIVTKLNQHKVSDVRYNQHISV